MEICFKVKEKHYFWGLLIADLMIPASFNSDRFSHVAAVATATGCLISRSTLYSRLVNVAQVVVPRSYYPFLSVTVTSF